MIEGADIPWDRVHAEVLSDPPTIALDDLVRYIIAFNRGEQTNVHFLLGQIESRIWATGRETK